MISNESQDFIKAAETNKKDSNTSRIKLNTTANLSHTGEPTCDALHVCSTFS